MLRCGTEKVPVFDSQSTTLLGDVWFTEDDGSTWNRVTASAPATARQGVWGAAES